MMNLKPHSNICQYGLLFARMPQNFNYSDRHELKLHHHYWKIRKLRKKTLIGKSWKYSTIVENTYTKYIFHPYNLWSSSLNLAFSCSLFILKAAVTNPDSGVHASGSNLIFAGVSNLSNFAVFATCRHLKKKKILFLHYVLNKIYQKTFWLWNFQSIQESTLLCTLWKNKEYSMDERKQIHRDMCSDVEYDIIFTYVNWFVSKETKESV